MVRSKEFNDLLNQSGARWASPEDCFGPGQWDDVQMVRGFGLDADSVEYAAISQGVGFMDVAFGQVIEVTGADRLDFLNRMLTNDLKSLKAGQGRRAFLLGRNGRIEADILVLHDQETTWMVIDRQDAASLIEELDKFIFTEKVKFRLPGQSGSAPDREHPFDGHLSLHGPSSAKLLDELWGQSLDSMEPLEPLEHRAISLFGQPCVVYRFDQTGSPGMHVFTSSDAITPIFKAMLQQAEKISGQDSNASEPICPVGWDAFNTARIEAGTPLFAIDFSRDNFPHEASMIKQTVSFNKGCYPGQEIVARMQNLGHPSKVLVSLRIDGLAAPGGSGASEVPGAQLGQGPVIVVMNDSDKSVGQMTSGAYSTLLDGAAIGLAMIDWNRREQGTRVLVSVNGQNCEATVQQLGLLIES
jgi:folate-binding protein YgfZ